MVSLTDVNYAYRLILGREPESQDTVQYLATNSAPLQDLRAKFFASKEFTHGFPDRSLPARMSDPLYAEPRIGLRPDQCSFYHTMDIPGVGLVEGYGWDHRAHVDDMFRDINFSGKRVLERILNASDGKARG
jgi:hypothetical protein